MSKPLAMLPGLFLLLTISAASAVEVWNIDDVQPGIKGVGRTVMRGHKLEDFDFEVIGVLRNVFPDQHIILARLSGLNLENTGVISGMSGSPLYADGKLLGAIAYGWAFSKEPIAGITPAASMIEMITDQQTLEDSRLLGQVGSGQHDTWAEHAQAPAGPDSISLRRLRAPLVISGSPLPVYNHFAREFEAMGMMPVQGGAGAVDNAEEVELVAGMPVAVKLIEGDINIAGIGTVTERIGDDIIAFGHPMLGAGHVHLPLATAEIATVIPSQFVSFKMGNAGRTVGTLIIDRTEGISGRIGQIPHTTDMRVTVHRRDLERTRTFNYRIAEHPRLTPMLVSYSVMGSLFMGGSLPSEFTLQYKVNMRTINGETLVFEDGGTSTHQSLWRLFDATSFAASTIMNNRFKPMSLENIDIELEVHRGDTTAFIESASLPRVKVQPGQNLRIELSVLHYRREPGKINVDVPIPANLPPGIYDIIVGDADTARQVDQHLAAFEFEPQNYREMMDYLAKQYPANRVYTRIILQDIGLEVQRRALPNLPASFLSMLTPTGGGEKNFITSSIKSSTRLPHLLAGGRRMQFIVEKED